MLVNPITIWLKWYVNSFFLEYHNKNLKIKYLAQVKNCSFGENNVIYDHAILSNITIGNYSYISPGSIIRKATIGKFCSIGPNVKIGIGNHYVPEYVTTHPAFFTNDKICDTASFVDRTYFNFLKNTTVGNDVWIGANAVIIDGVHIGDGSIIAAGAVVTKDVTPYAIVGGVPAKVIKYRFNKEQIKKLLELKWWDRDVSWLKNNTGLIRDINMFLGGHNND